VLHIKDHLKADNKADESKVLRKKVYELIEFLTDVLKIDHIEAEFLTG
jgi:L-lactate dehydrogenase complex protein LldE